jgi:hypothetical protein
MLDVLGSPTRRNSSEISRVAPLLTFAETATCHVGDGDARPSRALAASNAHAGEKACFLGAGMYDHFILQW